MSQPRSTLAAVIVAALSLAPGSAALAALANPAPAGAATAVTVPASIPSNCSRDVSAELIAWIASVPDGSTLSFTPNGCYRVDRKLTISYRNGLTFEGNGATFRAFTSGRELSASEARTRSMFTFWRGSNLTVRNTKVIGANPYAGVNDAAYVPALEAQTAYVIGGVRNMVLDHVAAYDVYGDFVFVGAATQGLIVRNSTFARNGRQGWTINGSDILFEHNTIDHTRRATIDLEPSSKASITQRVTIRNNTIGVGRLYFLANEGLAAPTSDISIIGNRFVGKAMTIRVNPPTGTRSRYRVVGNVSDTPVGLQRRWRVPVQQRGRDRDPGQRAADAAQPGDLGPVDQELPGRRGGWEPVPVREGRLLARRQPQRLPVRELRGEPTLAGAGEQLHRSRLIRAASRDEWTA